MVVNVKESFEKTRHVKMTTNLRNTFYVDKEMQDIMIEFYLVKRNLFEVEHLIELEHLPQHLIGEFGARALT